jgi:hypothetical protein
MGKEGKNDRSVPASRLLMVAVGVQIWSNTASHKARIDKLQCFEAEIMED